MKRNVVSWRKEGNWVGCLGWVSLPSTMLISASFWDVTTMLRFRGARWFQIVTINYHRWWLKEKVVGTFRTRSFSTQALWLESMCDYIDFFHSWVNTLKMTIKLPALLLPCLLCKLPFSKMGIWLQLCFHRFCLPARYHPESSPWRTSRILISWLRLAFSAHLGSCAGLCLLLSMHLHVESSSISSPSGLAWSYTPLYRLCFLHVI